MTLNDIINSFGILLYPLMGLSLLAGYFIIERGLYFLRLSGSQKLKTLDTMTTILDKNKLLDKATRDDILSYMLETEQVVYEKGLRFLRIIAVIAPMLGLLGTVIGMIDSFEVISLSNDPVAPAQIAGGMKFAMFTTAYGLIIAIPCMFFAYFYSRMSERMLGFLQHHLNKKSFEIQGVILP